MLNTYLKQTQRLLNDPKQQIFNVNDLIDYINLARGQVATDGKCVRLLLSGGTITALAVNSGGTGYSGTATVTISGSGQQATATATIAGGAISTVTLTNGGWGYITGTTTTVTAAGSGGGTNATFTTTIDNSLTTVAGQEVYQFSTANTLAALTSGVSKIIGVYSVACAWGANAAMKPILNPMIWSEFQAYLRAYNTGMESYPTIWSQYGQGVSGSIYLWPLPSQASQMDWDCYCLPTDLTSDTTTEIIPYPWTDAVPYYAAYLAYSGQQKLLEAERMFSHDPFKSSLYKTFMLRARAGTEPPFVPDYYQSDV